MSDRPLQEGWYLMSVPELEQELARLRGEDVSPSAAIKLSIEDALAYRAAGNLPDAQGRSLRLVLHVSDRGELEFLQAKRLLYEPDFHDAPVWRRAGSKPINVVPVRLERIISDDAPAWWQRPELAALEEEWRSSGTVAGIRVPAAYRGFVFKTVLALRAAGKDVTPESVADSISRWVPADEARRIRNALENHSSRSVEDTTR